MPVPEGSWQGHGGATATGGHGKGVNESMFTLESHHRTIFFNQIGDMQQYTIPEVFTSVSPGSSVITFGSHPKKSPLPQTQKS